MGWLGELLLPDVVLARALEGRPDVAIDFRYHSGTSNVAFSLGKAPAGAQVSTINLHNGWTVQTLTAPARTGIVSNTHALTLLVGGTLLSVLFGLLVISLGTGRRRAMAVVMEKTRELSHQALHDSLTGLPNRALVLDRAEQMLARANRMPGTYAGALFIDVDGFKHVNDNLGHAAGDQLLKVVGERLQSAVRDEDTVGRLGGDEFVVLACCGEGEETLNMLADRLTELLREPVELKDGRKLFSVTASIGVAIGRYDTPDALLRDADLALYSAKAAGKDRYELFDASMYTGAKDRLALETDLGQALAEGQLFLAYQPIVDLATSRLRGVEALLRWDHPQRGVVPPGEFICLAEDSGLIAPIGRWVLENACRQAAEWAADGYPINISGERLCPAARAAGTDRGRPARAGGVGAAGLAADAGGDRDHADQRRGGGGGAPTGAAAARGEGGDRRLRDRVRVAVPTPADAGGHPQDRSRVRGRARQRRPGSGPAGRDPRRRAGPLAVGDRRGGRGRRPAARAPGDGLRERPGLPPRAPR